MTTDTPQLNAHNKAEFPPAHTAEHLLNQTMLRMFGCPRSRNTHIERKKSKINWHLPVAPTAEQIAAVKAMMNELIAQDLPVTSRMVEREEIPSDVSLDKLPEGLSGPLRLVSIGNYDHCVCIGAHVKSTREIGHFRITSTSYKEGDFRIVYKTGLPGD